MKKNMNLIFTVSKAYAKYLTVLLESIKQNNSDTYLNCYIVHKELGEEEYSFLREIISEDVGEIHLIEINEEVHKMVKEVYGDYTSPYPYPVETYVRILYPWIIPQDIDRILSLGIDMIVTGNLSELYDMEFGDKLLIACRDVTQNGRVPMPRWDVELLNHFKRFEPNTIINTDMMLLAPKRIRGDFSLEDLKKAVAELEYNIPFIEQDLYSWVYHPKVRWVDSDRYNFQVLEAAYDIYGEKIEYEYAKKNALIIHYLDKPWNFKLPFYGEIHKIWWEYALQTRFFSKWILELISGIQGWKDKSRFFEHRDLLMVKEPIENIIRDYFKENGYQNIGVYGAGDYGEMFLDDAPKEYQYTFFDQRAKKIGSYDVKCPEHLEEYKELDVIIVTPFYFENIKHELRRRVSIPVINYSSIINNAYRYRYDVEIKRNF